MFILIPYPCTVVSILKINSSYRQPSFSIAFYSFTSSPPWLMSVPSRTSDPSSTHCYFWILNLQVLHIGIDNLYMFQSRNSISFFPVTWCGKRSSWILLNLVDKFYIIDVIQVQFRFFTNTYSSWIQSCV
jgi:hypothetical protein